jgi:pimeloyl-ACP methyl ester carboxylesterase
MVVLLVTGLSLLAVSQAPSVSHAQDDLPLFEEVDCAEAIPILEGIDGLYCGFLIVPENRADPNSYEIELAVVIVESFSDNPAPDPLLYLEGGPGGSGVFSIESWLNHPIRQTRDIILLDQRGTGFSYPSLVCEGENEDELAFLEDCRAQFEEQEIDLSQYTSANSAADIADLRDVLGIESWNILGVSYGTRLALTLMRDYPDGIRSVVIDSVYPPQVNAYEEQAVNIADSILIMTRLCAADAACNAAYPDLEQTLYQVVDDLNANPLEVEVFDEDGNVFDELYYGDDVISLMGNALYSRDVIPYLPLMIDELSRRESGTLSAMVGQEIGPIADLEEAIDPDLYDEFAYLSDADGMFHSVECTEEIPFNDPENAETVIEPYPDQLEFVLVDEALSLFDACDVWDVQPTASLENEPVVSDIPTLVFSGQLDPVTPPSWGDRAAEYLANSFAYELPGVGHGSIDAGDCPTGILLAFLDNPTAEPDASCVSQMGGPAFVLPGN